MLHGVHHKHLENMENRVPKDWQVASPLVMQGFSKFSGLFQVIMANPVTGYKNHTFVGGGFRYVLLSSQKTGEMIQFDLRICFNWVVRPTAFGLLSD